MGHKAYKHKLLQILPHPKKRVPHKDRVIWAPQGDTVRFIVDLTNWYNSEEPEGVIIRLTDGTQESPVLWEASIDNIELFHPDRDVWLATLPDDLTSTLREGSYGISVTVKYADYRIETVGSGFIFIESFSSSPHRNHPSISDEWIYEEEIEEEEEEEGD